MTSEKQKMLAGELYDALDPELVQARERARNLCQDLNATRESEQEARRRILTDLFGTGGESVWMQPPFYCDYGSNIHLGERVYFNCIVLDVCEVRIGDFTFFGPAVQIYAATHPMNAELRRTQEFGNGCMMTKYVIVVLKGIRESYISILNSLHLLYLERYFMLTTRSQMRPK